jgi:hypothetical protein
MMTISDCSECVHFCFMSLHFQSLFAEQVLVNRHLSVMAIVTPGHLLHFDTLMSIVRVTSRVQNTSRIMHAISQKDPSRM